MSQIEGGRWDGIARKLFNISAPVAVPALSDEVVPTFEIQNWEPELYALRRERLLTGNVFRVAAAAVNAHCAIFNPAGSNILVIVEELMFFPSADSGISWRLGSDLSSALGWVPAAYGNRDTRWPGGADTSVGRAGAQLLQLNSAVFQGDQIRQFANMLANVPQREENFKPIVLAPDTGFIVVPFTTNVTLQTNWSWRERPFNPQEVP